jgi:MbtH protein
MQMAEETGNFLVVINGEEQYSLWPMGKALPAGWKASGFSGTKQECLAHVDSVWADMRPLSLRKQMAEK